MMDTYQTIRGFACDELVEKRSRFIGYCKRVRTQDEAVAFISEIKTKHWDARHNVYAYVLREGGIERYSDDGEPQGTAGMPVLDVIRKRGVTDCVVVVTRYFGGVLLGAGGLVRAYSAAAKLGIDAAGVCEMELCAVCSLTCSYTLYGRIPSLIAGFGGSIDASDFADEVTVRFHLPQDALPAFNKALCEESSGKYAAEALENEYFEKTK